MSSFISVALQLISASALGAALQLLFASLCEAIKKLAHLESNLSSLRSTLELTNVAFVVTISRFNHAQPETEAFLLQLIKGEELIRKCSNVKWNVFKRLYYSIKVMNLEASTIKSLQTYAVAFHFRELARISEAVMNLEEKINEIAVMMTQLIVSNEVSVRCNCVREFG